MGYDMGTGIRNLSRCICALRAFWEFCLCRCRFCGRLELERSVRCFGFVEVVGKFVLFGRRFVDSAACAFFSTM